MGLRIKRHLLTGFVFLSRPFFIAAIFILVLRIASQFSISQWHGRSEISTEPDGSVGVIPAANFEALPDTLRQDAISSAPVAELTKALVVVSTSKDSQNQLAWLDDVPPDWQKYHYVTDAPLSSDLAVPIDKGNEAMAYLTYIIDHFDNLPDVSVFHHGHPRAWHQAMLSIDEVRNFRPQWTAKRGYTSLRCLPGCENIIPLANYAVDQSEFLKHGRDVRLTTLLDDFLDRERGERVAKRLASPCCAQFAASREAIQKRSLAWWTKLRQWLIDTPLPSIESGRLLEHTWHVWLGNESYHCPEYEACRCHVFGLGDCESYFALEESMSY